jgi:hypothetical protein
LEALKRLAQGHHNIEQSLDDELRSSLEVLTQEKMKQGLSQSERGAKPSWKLAVSTR